jgi:signal transduction histidine kinase
MTLYGTVRGSRRWSRGLTPATGLWLLVVMIASAAIALLGLLPLLGAGNRLVALLPLNGATLIAVAGGYLLARCGTDQRPPAVTTDSALESQKRFVANASHELRTPLTVIRTEIDVTLADPDADLAEFRRMAGVIRRASIRANAMVDALLVLARTEAQAGRKLVRKVRTDLGDGVRGALTSLAREAERSAVVITTTLEPAPVIGDPGLLDRLAGNLIENAVRYNHANGEIHVRTGGDGRYAWLVVGNTGVQVEQQEVPALFEPFRRGGMERTGNRGSGLGLSIVRAVCEAHGGTVTATAVAGGGLEVTVRLPVAATTPVHTGSAQVS